MQVNTEILLALYASRGRLAYDGEGVDQLGHAWQCAALAARAGAPATLCLAAFLHDIGHLFSAESTPTLSGCNDQHEITGASFLSTYLPESVTEPIRLHVQAKRYLVAIDPEYRLKLSPDSERSLVLQGGAMKGDELLQFMAQPFAEDALRLRTWDEQAKQPDPIPFQRLEMLTLLKKLISEVRE